MTRKPYHETGSRNDFDPKRARTVERRLLLTITVFLVVAAAFGLSFDTHVRAMPIVLWRTGEQRNAVNGQIRDGHIMLSSDVDYGAVDGPKPYIVSSRTLIVPRVLHELDIDFPGLRFSFCLLENCPAVWSVQFSLILPLIAASILLWFAIRQTRRSESLGNSSPRDRIEPKCQGPDLSK